MIIRQNKKAKFFFGAYVKLCGERDDQEVQVVYRIVGSDEIEANSIAISVDSPMAKALIGKQVDDEVKVTTPNGPMYWVIEAIKYSPF